MTSSTPLPQSDPGIAYQQLCWSISAAQMKESNYKSYRNSAAYTNAYLSWNECIQLYTTALTNCTRLYSLHPELESRLLSLSHRIVKLYISALKYFRSTKTEKGQIQFLKSYFSPLAKHLEGKSSDPVSMYYLGKALLQLPGHSIESVQLNQEWLGTIPSCIIDERSYVPCPKTGTFFLINAIRMASLNPGLEAQLIHRSCHLLKNYFKRDPSDKEELEQIIERYSKKLHHQMKAVKPLEPSRLTSFSAPSSSTVTDDLSQPIEICNTDEPAAKNHCIRSDEELPETINFVSSCLAGDPEKLKDLKVLDDTNTLSLNPESQRQEKTSAPIRQKRQREE